MAGQEQGQYKYHPTESLGFEKLAFWEVFMPNRFLSVGCVFPFCVKDMVN